MVHSKPIFYIIFFSERRIEKNVEKYRRKYHNGQTNLKVGTQSYGSKDVTSMIARLHRLLIMM
ncbi:hypothetical protein SAMN04490355_100275 [Pelosinus propionicus DSM 13327]|uniref:Uncharacterized protein n=1 Tax=Pelosinus propionicus DSM 13327 TaxID=1123291 RepID=A0A1I4GZT0_9FIRM|nr:hypothetical protein SAMN04490355_100275 [Pelosinus propionicus DSM 13327]